MGRELDFRSHVGDRPKKNIFFFRLLYIGSQAILYVRAIVCTKIKFGMIYKVYLGMSPSQ